MTYLNKMTTGIVFILLTLFGLFYHITSSEFWPITVSKTWWNLELFETSTLQKPLFTLFLSFFHLLPLNNVAHLLLVKLVFSVIGAAGLFVFTLFLAKLLRLHKNPQLNFFLLLIFLLSSSNLLYNFFRVRADQVAFLVFSLFLLSCEKRNFKTSLFYLLIIPFIAIKEFLFVMPGLILFFYYFKDSLFKKEMLRYLPNLIILLTLFLIFNLKSIIYLWHTYSLSSFPNELLSSFLQIDSLFLVLALGFSLYCLLSKKKSTAKEKVFGLSALVSFLIILILPESYPFFIASFSPLVYLPLVFLFAKWHNHRAFIYVIILAQIAVSYSLRYSIFPAYYISSFDQFQVIEIAENILNSKSKLSYLDGVGIMPKENFIPCLASYNDSVANQFCISKMQNNVPDLIIITERLLDLRVKDLPRALSQNYEEIRPNFWLKKSTIEEDPLLRNSFNKESKKPIHVFNYEG